ncbi:MAG: bile acid:sodium symporter [Bacteroidales bacterium]|jgi:sodium/bile acid cotransporter 7|nr:bile acid:sodium symporter [Bacteroidales bacterium]NLH24560.1 bile acid:sodium symporter [Bacteroidales bacterium]
MPKHQLNKDVPLLSKESGHVFARLRQRFARYGLDGFVLALITAIVVAYLWPGPGVYRGMVDLQDITCVGIALIFFFYGLRLNPAQLRTGLTNWRLHLVVQSVTFILFPALVLLVKTLAGGTWDAPLWSGTFFLAALPTTISSSVVLVSMGRGNVPAAIFNTSISSLLGIFLTPLWMGILLVGYKGAFTPTKAILQLSLQVVLPVFVGMMLHKKFGILTVRHPRTFRFFDQGVILLIVYVSFAESFFKKMFSGYSLWHILLLCAAMLALFFVVYGLTALIAKILKFNKPDTTTTVFCGSQKSLVHGTAMSRVLFPGFTATAVLLLPLMIYHTLQLIVTSAIVGKRR